MESSYKGATPKEGGLEERRGRPLSTAGGLVADVVVAGQRLSPVSKEHEKAGENGGLMIIIKEKPL